MLIQNVVHEIERAYSFRYPKTFVDGLGKVSSTIATEQFRDNFPGARFLDSVAQIAAARVGLPDRFLPFMIEPHPQLPDIYAFDLASNDEEFRVVVWCDTIVMDWDNFSAFWRWVEELLN